MPARMLRGDAVGVAKQVKQEHPKPNRDPAIRLTAVAAGGCDVADQAMEVEYADDRWQDEPESGEEFTEQVLCPADRACQRCPLDDVVAGVRVDGLENLNVGASTSPMAAMRNRASSATSSWRP